MHPFNPSVFAYAAMVQKEMEAKAERRRLVREHRAGGADEIVVGPLTTLRLALGALLVRAGERVRGAERATGGAHLRPVR